MQCAMEMLGWGTVSSRGYHQQLNHWRRMTPNQELAASHRVI